MKKIVFLSITLLLAVGLFSACGCAKKDNNSQSSAAPSQSAAASTSPESSPSASAAPDNSNNTAPGDSVQENDLPAVSENKEVVKEENAPKVFMIQNAESNVDKLTYHLENCKLLYGAFLF